MLTLFKSKSFLLTVVSVLICCLMVEVLLQLGVTKPIIKPKSYLGTALYRLIAVEKYGYENIEWITIGNSRFDWGLKHQQIYEHQLNKRNITHLRMSIESSDFYAIQTTIDWSIDHMPNLKGIILGVSEFDLSRYSDINNQYKVAWPFTEYENSEKYHYFINPSWLDFFRFKSGTAKFLGDFKDFLVNIHQRLREIKEFKANDFKSILFFEKKLPDDLCLYELSSVEQCKQTAKRLSASGLSLNGIDRFIISSCLNTVVENGVDKKKIDKILIKNWQNLFQETTEKGVELKVFLLPEHLIYEQILTNLSDEEGVMSLGSQIPKSMFELIDFRQMFRQEKNQCYYFRDPTHLSDKGKARLTKKVLETL